MPSRQRVQPWMLVAAIWVGPAFFAMLSGIAQRRLHGDPPATARDLLWAAGDWLVYAVVTPFILWISRRWPIVRPFRARRLALHLGFALLSCVAWAVGGKLLELVLVSVLEPERLQAGMTAAGDDLSRRVAVEIASWILTTIPFGIVVYITVAGLAHAITYFVEARERQVQMARLAEQLADARFSALQAQVNPHFLFNTLNTIAVLVRDGDRAGAVRIVEQLSEVLRRTLSRQRANEVTLDEELELVRQYLAIEQARFSDRLRPEIVMDDALRAAAVPSLAVQHLVENAIRHGIAKRAEAGRLRVAARRDGDVLEVSVTDDGPGFDARAAAVKPGHGLDNTHERLRALHGAAASLTFEPAADGGTVAILRVPWREIALEAGDAAR